MLENVLQAGMNLIVSYCDNQEVQDGSLAGLQITIQPAPCCMSTLFDWRPFVCGGEGLHLQWSLLPSQWTFLLQEVSPVTSNGVGTWYEMVGEVHFHDRNMV